MYGNEIVKVDAERVAKFARDNRWSVSLVAEKTGISRTAVWSILTGRSDPTAVNLKAICDVIGMPIEDAFVTNEFVGA